MTEDSQTLQSAFKTGLEKYLSEPQDQTCLDNFFLRCIDVYIFAHSSLKDDEGADESVDCINKIISPILAEIQFPFGSAKIMDDLLDGISINGETSACKQNVDDHRYAIHVLSLVWHTCNQQERDCLIDQITSIKATLNSLNFSLQKAESSFFEKFSPKPKLRNLITDLLAAIPDINNKTSLANCEEIVCRLYEKLDKTLYPLKNFCQGNKYLENIYRQLEKILNTLKRVFKSNTVRTPQEHIENIHQTLKPK